MFCTNVSWHCFFFSFEKHLTEHRNVSVPLTCRIYEQSRGCVLHNSFNKIQLMLNVESYWMLQFPCSIPFKALGSHLMENPRMCQLMRQHSLLVCWKTSNFTLMGSQFFLKNCSLHASFILSVGPNYSFSAFRVFFAVSLISRITLSNEDEALTLF